MCGLMTMMAVTAAISAGMTANAQIQQGKYQKNIGKYNERVAKNEAQEVRNVANEAENMQREETAQLIANQRVNLGASNVELSSGSASQLVTDSRILGEADALRIRNNSKGRIDSLNRRADMSRRQGELQQSIANQNAGASLLTGVSGVMDSGVADSWFTPGSAANQPVTTRT